MSVLSKEPPSTFPVTHGSRARPAAERGGSTWCSCAGREAAAHLAAENPKEVTWRAHAHRPVSAQQRPAAKPPGSLRVCREGGAEEQVCGGIWKVSIERAFGSQEESNWTLNTHQVPGKVRFNPPSSPAGRRGASKGVRLGVSHRPRATPPGSQSEPPRGSSSAPRSLDCPLVLV